MHPPVTLVAARRRIVYNATAWQQLVAGLTQPLWVAVPVIQVK